MDTMFLLLYAIGITVTLTQGSIFHKLRENGPALWKELVHCPLCLGFWVGAVARYLDLQDILGHAGALSWVSWGLQVIGFGAASGAGALMYRRVHDHLDSSAALADAHIEQCKAIDEHARRIAEQG